MSRLGKGPQVAIAQSPRYLGIAWCVLWYYILFNRVTNGDQLDVCIRCRKILRCFFVPKVQKGLPGLC